jgi:hypothetical protein
MSQLQVNRINDSSGGVLAPISSVMRNRLINGSFTIDQRNAGASVTPAGSAYTLDRWQLSIGVASKLSVQQVTTVPTGFKNSTLITTASAYTASAGDYLSYCQKVEGFNCTDLDWGTANAKTVTVSFWVRSSLTGTFSGAIQNSGAGRSYPFTFTISTANTWEYETITIAGDTSGTWLTSNGVGLELHFNLGSGSDRLGTAGAWNSNWNTGATGSVALVQTASATMNITGVQLEVGTQATSFEYRQYGTELALCQRYYYRYNLTTFGLNGFNENSSGFMSGWNFGFYMRAAPNLETTGTASDYSIRTAGAVTACSSVPTTDNGSTTCARINASTSGGLTAGQGSILISTTSKYLALSSEL